MHGEKPVTNSPFFMFGSLRSRYNSVNEYSEKKFVYIPSIPIPLGNLSSYDKETAKSE